MPADPISAYGKSLKGDSAEVCGVLRATIDKALPKATAKIWHGIPVWFMGANPVVGYTARGAAISLLFWNGQSFGEPALEAVGSFHAAQIKYHSVEDIDSKALARWLKRAGKDIRDMAGVKKTIAKKKKAKKSKA